MHRHHAKPRQRGRRSAAGRRFPYLQSDSLRLGTLLFWFFSLRYTRSRCCADPKSAHHDFGQTLMGREHVASCGHRGTGLTAPLSQTHPCPGIAAAGGPACPLPTGRPGSYSLTLPVPGGVCDPRDLLPPGFF